MRAGRVNGGFDMRWILVSAMLLVCAGMASAQTVVNPTRVEFAPSTDHATVTRYTLGLFIGGTDPVQELDMAKPTPNASNVCAWTLTSYPVGVTYTAKARAWAGTITSDWSNTTSPFYRTPAAPSALVVK